MRLTVLELASLEKKKEEEEEEERKLRFSICFLGFYKAELESYLCSGGSGLSIDIHFVDLEVSYHVFLPYLMYCQKISTTSSLHRDRYRYLDRLCTIMQIHDLLHYSVHNSIQGGHLCGQAYVQLYYDLENLSCVWAIQQICKTLCRG